MRLHKVAVVCVLLCIAVGVLVPHQVGSLYPAANVAFTVGTVAVIVVAWMDTRRDAWIGTYLASLILLSVAYRLRVLAFSSSFLGIDSDAYAIQIGRLIETGQLSAISFNFYRSAPYHFLEGALTGVLTAAPTPVWAAVYAVTVGIGVPLLAAAIVSRLRPGATATTVLAAGGASLLGFTLRYSFAPIAQISGTLFMLFAVFAGMVFVVDSRYRWFLVAVLFSVATTYAHKLTGIALGIALLGALVLVSLHPSTRDTDVVRPTLFLTVVVAALVLFQQLYLTNFGSVVAFKLSHTLTPASTSVPAPEAPTAAIEPYSTAVRAYRLAYLGLLVPVSGVGWLGWLWATGRSPERRQDVVFLGLVAPIAGLVLVMYPAGINPVRNLVLSEVLLLLVATVGVFWHLVDRPVARSTIVSGVVSVLFVGLVVSAGVSPIGSPDYQPVGRQYLTEPETHAKLWGYRHAEGEISTDQYYALATPPARVDYLATHERDESPRFVAITEVYLNRQFDTERPAMVAHRNCITTLRSGYGVWQLTYDASASLQTTYDEVYDDGCVAYYALPNGGNVSANVVTPVASPETHDRPIRHP